MDARTEPPFRAEHVGSLLRPRALVQARHDLAAGRIDAAFAALDRSRAEAEAGLARARAQFEAELAREKAGREYELARTKLADERDLAALRAGGIVPAAPGDGVDAPVVDLPDNRGGGDLSQ